MYFNFKSTESEYMRRTIIIFLAAVLALLSTACTKDNISSLSFSESEVVIRPGEAVKLILNTEPAGVSATSLSWTSSNPEAVTVDGEGVVTAVAFGESVITASSSSESAQCTVIVTIPAENISLGEDELFLRTGDSHTFEVTVTPSDAEHDFVWTSSAPEYVTVSEDGVATAVADGEAEITVTAARGAVSATCLVKAISYEPDDYVDEWGINHGKGVTIQGVTWAPVNCGYHETDYPYGKLYQWGRTAGQGYTGLEDSSYPISDATTPTLKEALPFGEIPEDNVHYLGDFDMNATMWMQMNGSSYAFDDHTTWNDLPSLPEFSGNPGIGNPCPDGWRVPTVEEFQSLKNGANDYMSASTQFYKDGPNGQSGRFFGENHASATATDYKGCLWFPYGGSRAPSLGSGGSSYNRQNSGEYWTASVHRQDGGLYGQMFYMWSNEVTDSKYPYARAYGLSVRCVKE